MPMLPTYSPSGPSAAAIAACSRSVGLTTADLPPRRQNRSRQRSEQKRRRLSSRRGSLTGKVGSNHPNPRSRNFDLFLVRLDGTGLEQVTTHGDFDGFPMFSPDGKKLVWASNRNATNPGDTNLFVADWVR